MAITGRPPSDNPRNSNAKAYDWTTVENAPWTGASPDLPSRGRRRWHVETREWWEVVRRMPHCRLWTETDWRFGASGADTSPVSVPALPLIASRQVVRGLLISTCPSRQQA